MKKGNIIQLTLIIVAVVIGFNALEALVTAIWFIFKYLSGGGNGYYIGTISSLLYLLIETLACFLLIGRSDQLSVYISEKAGAIFQLNLRARPESLLHILLVTMGIYFLIQDAPVLFTKFYYVLKEKSGNGFSDNGPRFNSPDWPVILLKIVLPLILLAASKPIAEYFAKKVSNEPITLDQQVEEIELSEPNTNEK